MNFNRITACFFFSALIFSSDPPSSFSFNQSSQQAFYFIVDAEVNGSSIQEEDWIGAFKGDQCVGSTQWVGQYTSVPVMGDDGTEFSEGYMLTGEIPEFIIWDASNDQMVHVESSDSLPWTNNGIYNIQMLPADEVSGYPESFSIQSYPNPFNGEVNICIESDLQYFIGAFVYDITGKLVDRVFTGNIFPGETDLIWSSKNLPSGVYLLQIVWDDGLLGKPMEKTNNKLYLIK